MRKLLSVIFLSTIFTSGCGGGGGGEDAANSAVPIANKTSKSISATWFYEYPNKCLETFQFNTDGSFEINSNQSNVTGSYSFDASVDSGARHSLILSFEQQNQGYDCESSFDYIVGANLELFASFPNEEQMQWYESNTGGSAIFTLDRAITLSLPSAPTEAKAGEEVTFNVNKDAESDTPVELLYGPTGMTVSSKGEVKWTPLLPMITQQNTVKFAFTSDRTLEPLVSEINVTIPNFKTPTMRKGIELAYTSNGMQIGNFIGDENNEMLVLDKLGGLSVISQKSDGFESIYSYPYSFGGNQNEMRLSVFKEDNGANNTFVGTNNNIYQVSDFAQPPRSVFSTSKTIHNFMVKNIDSDSEPELIVIFGESYSAKEAVVYDNNFQTELFSFSLEGDSPIEIAVANIDSDTSLELILSNGEIFDIQSASSQWFNADGFGSNMTTGDVNSDGIEEIISAGGWDSIKVWNANDRSQVLTIDNQDNCSVATANIDNDPADEIIIGDCQWGQVHGYDITDDTYTELWTLPLIDHGSAAMVVGDINNDGKEEIVWGTGLSHSGEDILVVASVTPNAEILWHNANKETPSQFDSYIAAGWANISPEKEAAVYIIPSTNSGYGGSWYITMNENGEVKTNNKSSSNYLQATLAAIGDIDSDNYDELFVFGALNYSPSLNIIELESDISKWQVTTEDDSSNYNGLEVTDINNDGYDDALIATYDTLTVHDISNNNILATWTASSAITSITATTSTLGEKLVILSTRDSLTTLTFENNKLSMRSSSVNSEECKSLYAQPQTDRVLCFSPEYSYQGNLVTFSLDLELLLKARINGEITSLVQLPNSDNVLITTNSSDNNYYSQSSLISEVSTKTGDIVWQGYPLAGEVMGNSIKFGNIGKGTVPLVFGTNVGMFLTH